MKIEQLLSLCIMDEIVCRLLSVSVVHSMSNNMELIMIVYSLGLISVLIILVMISALAGWPISLRI